MWKIHSVISIDEADFPARYFPSVCIIRKCNEAELSLANRLCAGKLIVSRSCLATVICDTVDHLTKLMKL